MKEGAKGYALYRKQEEMEIIDNVLKSGKKPHKHEEYRLPFFVRDSEGININLLRLREGVDGYKLYFDKSGKLGRGVYWWADDVVRFGGVREEVALSPKEVKRVAGHYGVLPS